MEPDYKAIVERILAVCWSTDFLCDENKYVEIHDILEKVGLLPPSGFNFTREGWQRQREKMELGL